LFFDKRDDSEFGKLSGVEMKCKNRYMYLSEFPFKVNAMDFILILACAGIIPFWSS